MIIRKNIKSRIKSKAFRSLPERRNKRHLSFYSSIERDIRDIEAKLYRIKKALKYYSEDSVEQNNQQGDGLDAKLAKVVAPFLALGNGKLVNNSKKRGFYKKMYYSSQSTSSEAILGEIRGYVGSIEKFLNGLVEKIEGVFNLFKPRNKKNETESGEITEEIENTIQQEFKSYSSKTREFAVKMNIFGILDKAIDKTVEYAQVSSQELRQVIENESVPEPEKEMQDTTIRVSTLTPTAKVLYMLSGICGLSVVGLFISFGSLILKLGTYVLLPAAVVAFATKLVWFLVALVILAIIFLVIAISIQSKNKAQIKKQIEKYQAKITIIYSSIKQKLRSRNREEILKAHKSIMKLKDFRSLIVSKVKEFEKSKNKSGEIVLNIADANNFLENINSELNEIKKSVS